MSLNRRKLLKAFGAGVAAAPFLQIAPAKATQHDAALDKNSRAHAGAIRLDRNENPYGPSKKAIVAYQASQLSRYPDASVLQGALAKRHNLRPQQIILGCGSSHVLRMAASTFLKNGSTLVVAKPTCGLIAEFARQRGGKVVEVPLRKDHAHDLSAMLERTKGAQAHGILYICNPNSPTGTLTPRNDIDEFIGKVPAGFHIVADEAYHEYAGGSGAYVSFVERPAENPRVIVTRSFSSGYALAGARIGYGVATEAVIEKLKAESFPYAMNGGAIAAAVAALEDQEHLDDTIKRLFNDRQEFFNQVNARMLRAFDSHANFVCLNVMRPAEDILEHYRKNNFVLAAAIPELPTYLRISIGTAEEMKEFWRVWDLLGAHPMAM